VQIHSSSCDGQLFQSCPSQPPCICTPQSLPNAVFGAGFAASLLGFKARGRLPQGTRVTVLKSTPAIIIACHGSVPPDNDSADLFEGEFVIDNLLNVGVHFLTTMAKLQAICSPSGTKT